MSIRVNTTTVNGKQYWFVEGSESARPYWLFDDEDTAYRAALLLHEVEYARAQLSQAQDKRRLVESAYCTLLNCAEHRDKLLAAAKNERR